MKHPLVSTIHPIHHSIQRLRSEGKGVRPKDMNKIHIPTELRDGLFEIAWSIFADCANVGVSFQDTLLAIYLSGLQHGQELSNES